MSRNVVTAVALLLITCCAEFCMAQQNSQPAPSDPVSTGTQFQERYPRYVLQSGDSFDLAFEYSPEFNQTLTVQPDGFVIARGVGDLHLAGQTIPQATQTLEKAYTKILVEPDVTIMMKEFVKPYFTVGGEVGKPGKYELHGDTTVTEGVAMAGGFLASAKHSQVLLFRRVSDQWLEARIINVKKMVRHRSLAEDLHLQPGDMLIIPKNSFSKIEPFLPRAAMGVYAQQF